MIDAVFSLSSLRYRPRVSDLTYTGNSKWTLFKVLTHHLLVAAYSLFQTFTDIGTDS